MQDNTRQQLLAAAKNLFAEKGFYGASIAGVASEVGITKQALLYHFKRKEDLYSEVLQEISERLLRFVSNIVDRADPPERQLEDILLGLYVNTRESLIDNQILVRELLDNQARAETAKDWFLRPFLSELTAVARRIEGFEKATYSSVFCMVYQLLGSMAYFAISTTTLKRMYGEETYEGFQDRFPIELRTQVRCLIDHQIRLAEKEPTAGHP